MAARLREYVDAGDATPHAHAAWDRYVALVASDGHSRQRPPQLDQAHGLLVERYGEASIEVLFDESALPWIP